MSVYDPIAAYYDTWSGSVLEDIQFYVDLARAVEGPIIELGVGTGRIAVPIAETGADVVGVDSSAKMLALCALRAERAGVRERLDLRIGELQQPPHNGPVQLVIVPFRAYLHLASDAERLVALQAAFALLEPGGQLAFDVFRPSEEDIAQTHERWLEREPGIWERAEWNESTRELVLSIWATSGETVMHLHWADAADWRRLLDVAGFEIAGEYGWFDGRPLTEDEDMVWIARRPRS